jgi:hypothetical protein
MVFAERTQAMTLVGSIVVLLCCGCATFRERLLKLFG